MPQQKNILQRLQGTKKILAQELESYLCLNNIYEKLHVCIFFFIKSCTSAYFIKIEFVSRTGNPVVDKLLRDVEKKPIFDAQNSLVPLINWFSIYTKMHMLINFPRPYWLAPFIAIWRVEN